jgi:Na+-driven multidrug efflux pump
LAAASQGLVADALGRNSHHHHQEVTEISKTVLVYSTILGTVLAGLLWIGFSTEFLLTLFTSNAETQADLMDIALLIVLAQPLNSLVFAADGVLQGAAEFPYQAKSMAVSAAVAGIFYVTLQEMHWSDALFQVWSALIALQFMRGVTSAYKIVDRNGPIRLLE